MGAVEKIGQAMEPMVEEQGWTKLTIFVAESPGYAAYTWMLFGSVSVVSKGGVEGHHKPRWRSRQWGRPEPAAPSVLHVRRCRMRWSSLLLRGGHD